MTSIQALRLPAAATSARGASSEAAATPHEPHATGSSGGMSTKTKVALAGLGVTSLLAGGTIGAMRGALGKGILGGALVGGALVGAALLGGASRSFSDGYCDYYGDPDCDYPVPYDPYPYDPYPYDPPYRPGYPDPDRRYDPGNGPGDSW